MYFQPEFLERLRDAVPISQVIGRRIALKRMGRAVKALCPFHSEKSPSFTLNDEKGFFHCFGCGVHGDAITFIQEYEKTTFPEAVERLAAEVGMQIPQASPMAKEREQKRHTLEEVVHLAAEWFTQQFQSDAGREARHYTQQRGISEASLTQFGIGFAPDNRDDLYQALKKSGIPEQAMLDAGLIVKAEDGRCYDRFRGRLIFPIRNNKGKEVAFGGRLLPSASTKTMAKYLNSPETELFKKGEMLFAYDSAARHLRANPLDALIVAEGYMDVIALHQAGFPAAVAPLGTAITEMQLQLMWRLSPEPVLCLDGDVAGQKAMQRAAFTALPLLKAGLGLRFTLLPKGEDPDSMLKKSGNSVMKQMLMNATILSEVLWENALRECGKATAEQRAALESHLTKTAELIKDPIVKPHIAQYFKDQVFRLRFNKKSVKMPDHVKPSALPEANDTNAALRPIEEALLAIIILCPILLHRGGYEEMFTHIDFSQGSLDIVRNSVLEVASLHEDLSRHLLMDALRQQGLGEMVGKLTESGNRFLPKLEGNDEQDEMVLKNAFDEHYASYQEYKIGREIHQAEQALGQEISEANLLRLQALMQEQKEILLKKYNNNSLLI